jgi:MoaA/NifB/PqqE/SkfB family radical SAM enzyme
MNRVETLSHGVRHSPDELETLKRNNDLIAQAERVTRPDVVRAWPQYLTMANTFKCNLDCPMCFKQLDETANMSLPDMDWAIFERAAHELFPYLRLINLSVSGEPLISKNIFRELEMLRLYRVKTDVTTNGMPLSRPGLLEALLPVCRRLTISFDGATKETFEYVRKKARWETVLKNLKLFDEMRNTLPPGERPMFQMSHVYQHANATEPVLLVDLAHELGVDFLHVAHVYIHRDYQKVTSALNHRRLANEMLGRAKARADELGLASHFPPPYDLSDGSADQPYETPTSEWLVAEARKKLVTRPYRSVPESSGGPLVMAWSQNVKTNEELLATRNTGTHLPASFDYGVPQLGPSLIPGHEVKSNSCLYPWREAFINWDGQIGPCCSPALLDAGNMGNLCNTSFAEIWNGPVYQRLRSSIRTGKTYKFCRHCYIVNPEDPESYNLT